MCMHRFKEGVEIVSDFGQIQTSEPGKTKAAAWTQSPRLDRNHLDSATGPAAAKAHQSSTASAGLAPGPAARPHRASLSRSPLMARLPSSGTALQERLSSTAFLKETQKRAKIAQFHLYEVPTVVTVTGKESRREVTKDWGKRG